MELQARTSAALNRYWTAFFGCTPSAFEQAGTVIVPHAALGDYHGIWLFRRAQTLIISLPAQAEQTLHTRLADLRAADFDDPALLTDWITPHVERVIGAAWIGYTDDTSFRPAHDHNARLLGPDDAARFTTLRAACSAEAWEHGGSDFGELPLAGYMIDDRLVALAGYELWGDRIAHIAVVTHPAYRGRGYGTAAVSLLAETVLRAGLIPQYRTLASNTASLAIGRQLGFVGYAHSIAIRLR